MGAAVLKMTSHPSLSFAEGRIIIPEMVLMLLTLSMQFCASHCFLTLKLILWHHVGGGDPIPISRKTGLPRLVSCLSKGGAGIRTPIFHLNVYSFQHAQIPANPFVAIKAHFLPSLRGTWNSCSASPIIMSLHMYESCDFVPFQLPLRQVKSPRFCSS